jgi:uncharacterized protein YcfL
MKKYLLCAFLLFLLVGCSTVDDRGVVVEKPWHIFGVYRGEDVN